MLHAARNGFFYVFDRRDGKLLLAKPFVRNLTWASGIGADGRPIRLPEPGADAAPARRCARRRTARRTGSRRRSTRRPVSTTCRRSRSAASTRRASRGRGRAASRISADRRRRRPIPKPQRVLKAIDIHTGAIKWELPQPAPAQSWGGTLATATGLVIFGEDGGGLMAADAVDRQAAVELSDQPDVAGVADDLHVRRQAVHRGRRRDHHHRAGDPVTGHCDSSWHEPALMLVALGRSRRRRFRTAEIANGRIRRRSTCRMRRPATTAARASTGRASSPA